MQVSGKGAAIGFLADMFLGTFPLGTGIGALAKNLTRLDAGDMDRAQDPARATQGQQTYAGGDLRGMAAGLMGEIKGFIDRLGQPTAQAAAPGSDAEAHAQARPRVDNGATPSAQRKSGFGGWGKVLLWGGAALAGLSLLNNIPFFGSWGMPFYGAGMGWGGFPGYSGYPGLFW